MGRNVRGYTGTQTDDYTGTPLKKRRSTDPYRGTQTDDYTGSPKGRVDKVKPKPRDAVKARIKAHEIRKRATAKRVLGR